MSASVGNQFWKQRSKHGRDLMFSSSTLLWESCCKYFETTDARKWIKKDWVGREGREVEIEMEVPYTVSGLRIFLGIGKQTWYDYAKREDFSDITARIREIMFTQKFEGACVGVFNANIIARDLGLRSGREVNIINRTPVITVMKDGKVLDGKLK